MPSLSTSPAQTISHGSKLASAATASAEKRTADAGQVSTTTTTCENELEEEMITIKRTYDFAGETISEEKRVPKSSAEARLYFESQQATTAATQDANRKAALRRPKKRISTFDPGAAAGASNPTSSTSLSTAKQGVGGAVGGVKLNTIEKSKLDWAGFVDKEGIKEDLDEHGRAKEGYLDRMDFLGRVHANRDQDLQKAKGRGKGGGP